MFMYEHTQQYCHGKNRWEVEGAGGVDMHRRSPSITLPRGALLATSKTTKNHRIRNLCKHTSTPTFTKEGDGAGGEGINAPARSVHSFLRGVLDTPENNTRALQRHAQHDYSPSLSTPRPNHKQAAPPLFRLLSGQKPQETK